MTTRIETGATVRWGSHTARVHLLKDRQQLSADARSNADPHVIASDKAAIVESRRQVAQVQGDHMFDVTV